MPLYDFQCKNCGLKEEDVVAKSDQKCTVCANCGATTVRLISAPSRILFKSKGGYYSTEPD